MTRLHIESFREMEAVVTEKESKEAFPKALVKSYREALIAQRYTGSLQEWSRLQHMIYRTRWAKEHDTEPKSYRHWIAEQITYEEQCGF